MMQHAVLRAFGALMPGASIRPTAGAQRTIARTVVVPWHQRMLLSQFRTAPKRLNVNLHVSKLPSSRTNRGFRWSGGARRGADKAGKAGSEAEEQLSLSGRLKKLSREYGWTALGVYMGLSVLDFPLCFLLVRTVGTEKIAHFEDMVVQSVKKVIPEGVRTWWRDVRQSLKARRHERTGELEVEVIGHGVEEAVKRSKQEGASLATQLALAYAIHKSFIFLRVPLTAAITPKVVKVLRSWGWEIGKRRGKHA